MNRNQTNFDKPWGKGFFMIFLSLLLF